MKESKNLVLVTLTDILLTMKTGVACRRSVRDRWIRTLVGKDCIIVGNQLHSLPRKLRVAVSSITKEFSLLFDI